jgi:OTU domain-containing protein 6
MEETLEQLQARHRREQRDVQARVTSKKKNATKKTRKGINDECAQLEREVRERQADELRQLARRGGQVEGAGDGAAGGDPVEGEPASAVKAVLRFGDGAVPGDAAAVAVAAADQAGPSSEAQPQKRNRQKERLARRTAEQEAAAAAAEKEASTMVDHRGIERGRMLKVFEANSLVEKEIQPDGHCLFSAVADQLAQGHLGLTGATATATATTTGLGGSEGEEQNKESSRGVAPYQAVRHAATEYMRLHQDDFAPFMEEDFETYVSRMRDTAEWGGQLELQALANAYGVKICVVQDGSTEVIGPSSTTSSMSNGAQKEKGDAETRRRIWLAYYRHGYGLGEHYNSLRPKGP